MNWQKHIKWQNIALFISTILLLLLPDTYFLVVHREFGVEFILLGTALVLPIALLITLIPNLILQVVLLLVALLITQIEVLSVYTYYNFMNTVCFPAFFYSAPSETSDMSYYIIHSAGVHEIFPILLCVCAIVFAIFGKKFYKVDKQFKWTSSLAMFFFVAIIYVCGNKIYMHSPYHFGHAFTTAIQMEQTRKRLLPLSESFSYKAQAESNDSLICVLAIGESLNYEHCSLNGVYPRSTMPQLQKVKNLILYTDYYAGATYTQQSVPMLITRAMPLSFDDNYKEKSIVSAFKESGFRTYVVSHKSQIFNNGVHDYLAKDADSLIFVNNDRDLVDNLKQIRYKGSKVFVLLHFLGNHFFYSNYPKMYSRWTPNYTYSKDVKSDSLFINAYDNSILYTDSLLAASIESLKNMKSILLFVPDHGEYLDSHVGGHGMSYVPNRNEYHVPLLVWTSDAYKASDAAKYTNVMHHRNSPVCSDHVFWSVLDMAGIRIDSRLQQPGMSIFGDTLLPHKRELLLPDGKSVINLK